MLVSRQVAFESNTPDLDWRCFFTYLANRTRALAQQEHVPVWVEAQERACGDGSETRVRVRAPGFSARDVREFLFLLHPWIAVTSIEMPPCDVAPPDTYVVDFASHANAAEAIALGHGRRPLPQWRYPYATDMRDACIDMMFL